MTKQIDLNKSVFELTEEYPELIDVMCELGFSAIAQEEMRSSVGKLVTIPKGAAMKQIPMEKILDTLRAHGFEAAPLSYADEESAGTATPQKTEDSPSKEQASSPDSSSKEERLELLKQYLRRLGAGEDLESVRADFVAAFQDVDASEIMYAEQELIKEGAPIDEVQRLCDVHSALFHGATREEEIANAERSVQESLKKNAASGADYSDKRGRAAALIGIPGHPLSTFTRENEELEKRLATLKAALEAGQDPSEALAAVRPVSIHYAKKGDLLYPNLKVKYGISGPSEVMWSVDDEIRDEIAKLLKTEIHDDKYLERVRKVGERASEMIYKESNILFPICAVNFTDEEWKKIYRDSQDYALCFGVAKDGWADAEEVQGTLSSSENGEIVMPGGHMSVEQLTALLNTLPIEITFVDADNINRFFNEGPKVFKRPGMAIDREVFSCHPPKVEAMVRSIISSFREGRRDEVPVWMEKNGRTMLVRYMAVRDRNRNYLGTVEVVQDMEFAKDHFAKETGRHA